MKLCVLMLLAALVGVTSPTLAEPAGKTRVVRRVEKHDQQRSRARVHTIEGVVIPGRPARPQASFEISVQRFRFPVGTARYSDRDQRFLERGER